MCVKYTLENLKQARQIIDNAAIQAFIKTNETVYMGAVGLTYIDSLLVLEAIQILEKGKRLPIETKIILELTLTKTKYPDIVNFLSE